MMGRLDGNLNQHSHSSATALRVMSWVPTYLLNSFLLLLFCRHPKALIHSRCVCNTEANEFTCACLSMRPGVQLTLRQSAEFVYARRLSPGKKASGEPSGGDE